MASLARIAAAGVVVVAVVAAFVLAAAGAAGGDDDGNDTSSGGGEFDWLTAKNGRGEFRDGFATADAALAAGFVATGINATTITLTITGGAYHAVLRGGRYYSNEENPDTSKDIPASAEVFGNGGRRLFAAKGYKFMEARQQNNAIVIRHWRGTMGCGLTDYHLLPTGENLTIQKAETISTKDNAPCKTQ